jgi:hypothetical protein
MSTSDENQETEVTIPPFLERWSLLFFMRFPNLLWDVGFWFDVIIKRKPIYWNNVVKIVQKFRKEHPHCTFRIHTEECRKQMLAKSEELHKQMIGKRPLGWHDES